MEKRQGWVIGRIAGARVTLKPSALVMVGVLAVLFAPTVRAMGPDMTSAEIGVGSLVLVLSLMLSVFLHEVAHALVARGYGMKIHEIALTLWGGHTSFSERKSTPLNSAVIAIVGPLTNGVLALLAWWGYQSQPTVTRFALFCYVIAFANGAVAVFNLLPGLPLDGGQVAEAIVWAVTSSRRTGILAAAWIGRVLAVALVVFAIAVPSLRGDQVQLVMVVWAALIGSFMWSAATQALAQSARRDRIETIDPRALAYPAVTIDAAESVAAVASAVAGMQAGGVQGYLILTSQGRPVAYVDPSALSGVPADLAATTPAWAAAIAIADVAVIDGSLTGMEFYDAVVRAAPFSLFCVVVERGAVVAVVRAADVARAVHLD